MRIFNMTQIGCIRLKSHYHISYCRWNKPSDKWPESQVYLARRTTTERQCDGRPCLRHQCGCSPGQVDPVDIYSKDIVHFYKDWVCSSKDESHLGFIDENNKTKTSVYIYDNPFGVSKTFMLGLIAPYMQLCSWLSQ